MNVAGEARTASVLDAVWDAVGAVNGVAVAIMGACAVVALTVLTVVLLHRGVHRVAGNGGIARWAVMAACGVAVWLGVDLALGLLRVPTLVADVILGIGVATLVGGALLAMGLGLRDARWRRRSAAWVARAGESSAAGPAAPR